MKSGGGELVENRVVGGIHALADAAPQLQLVADGLADGLSWYRGSCNSDNGSSVTATCRSGFHKKKRPRTLGCSVVTKTIRRASGMPAANSLQARPATTSDAEAAPGAPSTSQSKTGSIEVIRPGCHHATSTRGRAHLGRELA